MAASKNTLSAASTCLFDSANDLATSTQSLCDGRQDNQFHCPKAALPRFKRIAVLEYSSGFVFSLSDRGLRGFQRLRPLGTLSVCVFSKIGSHFEVTPRHDIVDTTVVAGTFKTLVAAIISADFGATLKGNGPFIVFAHNDDAFVKLPAGTVVDFVKPENKPNLTLIPTYHVMPGKVTAADVADKKLEPTTVNRQALHFDATWGVTFNGSPVVAADIDFTNGATHVIDTAMMPTTQLREK